MFLRMYSTAVHVGTLDPFTIVNSYLWYLLSAYSPRACRVISPNLMLIIEIGMRKKNQIEPYSSTAKMNYYTVNNVLVQKFNLLLKIIVYYNSRILKEFLYLWTMYMYL